MTQDHSSDTSSLRIVTMPLDAMPPGHAVIVKHTKLYPRAVGRAFKCRGRLSRFNKYDCSCFELIAGSDPILNFVSAAPK